MTGSSDYSATPVRSESGALSGFAIDHDRHRIGFFENPIIFIARGEGASPNKRPYARYSDLAHILATPQHSPIQQ